jgi:predicted nucleotidyltransferase
VTPNTKLNLIEVVGDFFNPKQIEELFEQLNISGTTTESEIQLEDSPDISLSSSAITKAQIDLLITYASSRLKEDNFLALLLLLSNASLTLGDFTTSLGIM